MVLRRSYQSSPCFAVALPQTKVCPHVAFRALYAHASFSGPQNLHTSPEAALLSCQCSCSPRAQRHEPGGQPRSKPAQMRALNATCGLAGHARTAGPELAWLDLKRYNKEDRPARTMAGGAVAGGLSPPSTSLFRMELCRDPSRSTALEI